MVAEVQDQIVSLNGLHHVDGLSERIGIPGTLEWIPANELEVDSRYQRIVSPAAVRKMARTFDGDAFGVLIVSERYDKRKYLIDGQHRVATLAEMKRETERVPCMVYRGLTIEDEAKIFYYPQASRRALTAGQKFRARLLANEPRAIAIHNLVREAGFNLNFTDGNTSNGQIVAVGAIEYITRYGMDNLSTTLDVIRQAWKGETDGVTSELIRGLGTFCARYEGRYQFARLIKTLQDVSARRITQDGKDVTNVIGCITDVGTARAILRRYNMKLSSRRLPEWDEASLRTSKLRGSPSDE